MPTVPILVAYSYPVPVRRAGRLITTGDLLIHFTAVTHSLDF
jgi:hypothetical protein